MVWLHITVYLIYIQPEFLAYGKDTYLLNILFLNLSHNMNLFCLYVEMRT